MIDIPDTFLPKDEQGQTICPQCKHVVKECRCPSFDPTRPKTDRYSPVARLEKSGRAGKTVSLIRGLPADESYLKRLTKILKTRTGSGGTYYVREGQGIIEIQGNHLPVIDKILMDENFAL